MRPARSTIRSSSSSPASDPARSCRPLGIATLHDLPGVGENLQDHLEFYFQVASHAADHAVSPSLSLQATRHDRPALAPHQGRARRHQSFRELRLHPLDGPAFPIPTSSTISCPSRCAMTAHAMATEHGFQAHVGPMRSKSRGHVRLQSSDPRAGADDPLQLYEPSGRLGRDAGLRPPHPRDLRARSAFDPYRGREIAAGRRGRVG